MWVLTDDHPGNTTQSVGLAKALGWPYEPKALRFTLLVHLHDLLFGMFGATRLGLQRTHSAVLTPPWPDLVITTGWRTAHIARWIKKQSHDHTRLVQMGRKGTHVAQLYDLAISCRYFRLPPDSRRIETLVPLTEVSSEQLRQAAERWKSLFADTPHPRIALLVGGKSYACRFDEETAYRLGVEVRSFAEGLAGTVFASTSRRTGRQAAVALKKGLGDSFYLHEWQPEQSENPYFAYLALADILIVTGESESMLAEAAATGKPVYIYPLPKRQLDRWTRVKEWIVARGEKQRFGLRRDDKASKGAAVSVRATRRTRDHLTATRFTHPASDTGGKRNRPVLRLRAEPDQHCGAAGDRRYRPSRTNAHGNVSRSERANADREYSQSCKCRVLAVTGFPRVTVVIPVYNREKYVGIAVDSILSQTFSDFELVVVDDGSTDRSIAEVLSYSDPRIRLVTNHTNLGVSASRNKGVQLARGEYLAFLDSDDWAYPERLAKQTAFLDSHPVTQQ